MGKKRKNQKWREEESSSDDDDDILDVDFEFFDPQPEHDFHGLKTLLRQLLDADAQSVDVSALADLILAQPLLGSTVKVDGNESDPYAFLTVVNLKQHKQRCQGAGALAEVSELLLPTSKAEVGLILTDRLLNMPSELVPPMYKMLLEEVAWAVEDKEAYTFSHYLVLSKTYTEIQSELDVRDERPKKKRGSAAAPSSDVFYFHPEDEVLHKHALARGNFQYAKEASSGDADARRAFQDMGIKPQGHLVLIEAPKLEKAVAAIEQYLQPAA